MYIILRFWCKVVYNHLSILFVLLSRPYVDDYGFFTLTDLLSMMIDKGFIGDRDDIVNALGFILK
jgi:hypothetical protein